MCALHEFSTPVTNWRIEHEPSNTVLPTSFVIFFQDLVVADQEGQLLHAMYPDWMHESVNPMHIGCMANRNIQAITLTQQPPESIHCLGMRRSLALASKQETAVLSSAFSFMSWHQRYQYCFTCAAPLVMADGERAKVCAQCNTRSYPHVSPCIIVAIIKGQQLLLARAPHFKAGRYSVLAGFIEPGESAEDAVCREVYEEAHIEVKNIEYVGSQGWPFPSQLMLGFICEYKSGHIELDSDELEEGGWYDIDDLPETSLPISISHFLIKEAIRRIKGCG